MERAARASGVRATVSSWRARGERVALVPTMGYLHEGHLSLVRRARGIASRVVVSIFVNPLQFDAADDLANYPRDLERDSELLAKEGVDLLFCPMVEEMYPSGFSTRVLVDEVTERLCGASRPGHFDGVATVVLKLFNMVSPDLAVFGQKDAQQHALIRRLVKDLNLPIEISIAPISRGPDGVALSSRNVRLSEPERQAAGCLVRALRLAETLYANGERRTETILHELRQVIESEPLAELDYLEIVDPDSIAPISEIAERALCAVAARFGSVRLIDNVVLGEPGGRPCRQARRNGETGSRLQTCVDRGRLRDLPGGARERPHASRLHGECCQRW